MKRFDLPRLVGIHKKIEISVGGLKAGNLAQIPIEDIGVERVIDLCTEIQELCEKIEFKHPRNKAYSLIASLKRFPSGMTGIELAGMLSNLQGDLNIAMFDHFYVQIENSVRKYLDAKALFAPVPESFPSAITDMEDAGRCLALGLDSAAIFHLMHVVEWGLRGLAINLGLSKSLFTIFMHRGVEASRQLYAAMRPGP